MKQLDVKDTVSLRVGLRVNGSSVADDQQREDGRAKHSGTLQPLLATALFQGKHIGHALAIDPRVCSLAAEQ